MLPSPLHRGVQIYSARNLHGRHSGFLLCRRKGECKHSFPPEGILVLAERGKGEGSAEQQLSIAAKRREEAGDSSELSLLRTPGVGEGSGWWGCSASRLAEHRPSCPWSSSTLSKSFLLHLINRWTSCVGLLFSLYSSSPEPYPDTKQRRLRDRSSATQQTALSSGTERHRAPRPPQVTQPRDRTPSAASRTAFPRILLFRARTPAAKLPSVFLRLAELHPPLSGGAIGMQPPPKPSGSPLCSQHLPCAQHPPPPPGALRSRVSRCPPFPQPQTEPHGPEVAEQSRVYTQTPSN